MWFDVVGGDGHDDQYGGQGGDFLAGGDGDDRIFGRRDFVVIKVLRFHERHSLQGYGDTDLLFGGAEDDYVFGK